MILVYLSAASFMLLTIHVAYMVRTAEKSNSPDVYEVWEDSNPAATASQRIFNLKRGFRQHVNALGGPVPFAFSVTRLLTVLALLGLCTAVILHGIVSTEQGRWLGVVWCSVYVRSQPCFFDPRRYFCVNQGMHC